MSFTDQSPCRVRCEWGSHGVDSIAQSFDVVVIVDVLVFSTCVEIVTSRSASVLPYQWKDDSVWEFANAHNAILAGKRCKPSEGLSLSPASLLDIPEGTKLVLPSPNGSTLTIKARTLAKHVVAGCLRNSAAVAKWASAFDSVAVIPAGERWPDESLRPAIEDLIGAGAIIRNLPQPWSPEAQIAVAAFDSATPRLLETLLKSSSGRELVEKGFPSDVELAAQLDISDCVPHLEGDAYIRVN